MIGTFYLKSSYSMLESLIDLKDLFKYAKKENYSFISLADSKLHGSYELFKYAEIYDINPILGLSIKVSDPDETFFNIYVKNDIGYENLLKLSFLNETKSSLSINDLINYQTGLIFVSSGYKSIIDQTVIYGNKDEALNYIKKYNTIFDDFYVGLNTNYNDEFKTFDYLYNILNKEKVKYVLLNETNYLKFEDKKSYEILIKINDRHNKIENNLNYHFLSGEIIKNIYNKYPLIKKNHIDLINSITYKHSYPKFNMPKYQTRDNIEVEKYLYKLSHIGLSKRLKQNKIKDYKPYVERLDYELNIINRMNFTNYFLIVYDFVRYAKINNVLVGPGRGSAAGSLTSYVLGITEVDPIKYNLMFERFLNPERTSMPDIDLDFPDNKRDYVIDYVKEKYGINHIASITTFQTMQLNSSIRDVARVFGIDNYKLTGIIDSIKNNTYDKTDKTVFSLASNAKKIEGLYRQTGTHPAGIVLSDKDLFKYIPMQKGAFDFYQTQFEMNTLEKLGLVKIDFLGIRNLTIISNVLEELKKRNINININQISLEDKLTYKLLSSGMTTGIFQLESSGMRNVLKKLKPENFEDIVATLALYRPGPMENIDLFIRRKRGEKFNYIHKDLTDILKPTYGIIVYQEQIMQIARKFANYSLVEADLLRVGISKKDINILKKDKEHFINSSVKNGYSYNDAKLIYDYILKFADYGFNRSHSVSYGLVSYQMAYLKANYFLEFMKELLNSVVGNQNQTKLYINEIINKGYEVLPPNINISTNEYVIFNNKLYMPLVSVKSFGIRTYEEFIEERNKNGDYKDFFSFKTRLQNILNDANMVNLINSSALDIFELNKSTMLNNKELKTAGVEYFIKDFKVTNIKELDYISLQQNEKDALGFNLKYNINELIISNEKFRKYLTIEKLKTLNYNRNYKVCGIINEVNTIYTKDNKKMMFMSFNDGINFIDITVFPNQYEEALKIDLNKIVCINLKKDKYKNKDSYVFIENIKI